SSPHPSSPHSPSAQPGSAQPGSARSSTPDLDAWGEPQKPMPQSTMPLIDERPVKPYAPDPTHAGDVAQKRLIAGLLAIFLGSLGVHKFYLGLNTQGILVLGTNIGVWVLAVLIGLVTLLVGFFVTLPLASLVSAALGLLGLVEGILYLTKSDEDFQRDYLVGKKPWL
ncbi:TM2 domain-containing protein, partial [Deinococcus saxicola]